MRRFVCATSAHVSQHTVKLTSYYNPWRSIDLVEATKIWEAGRATSAASTFFEPIMIGPYREVFVDGGTGANNPIRELWTEANDMWIRTDESDTRQEELSLDGIIQCLVSIGTGLRASRAFGNNLVQLADSLKILDTLDLMLLMASRMSGSGRSKKLTSLLRLPDTICILKQFPRRCSYVERISEGETVRRLSLSMHCCNQVII